LRKQRKRLTQGRRRPTRTFGLSRLRGRGTEQPSSSPAAHKLLERRYRAIIDDQVDLIRRFRPDGTLTFVNAAFCSFYQLREEEALGRNFAELLSHDEVEQISEAIFSLTPDNPTVTTAPRYVRHDGHTYWLEYVTHAIFNAQGDVIEYQSIGRDITAQKKAELEVEETRAAVNRAQRMATLAVIGGGIAHEISQPLSSIRILAGSGLYMLDKMDPVPLERIQKNLQDISSQVDRIDQIITHLREFLRTNQTSPAHPCDLNDCVESSLRMVQERIQAEEIHMTKELEAGLPAVYGVRIRFEELILNLLLNAVQELKGRKGAKIRLRTWADRGAHFEIRDNGPGLAPEIQNSIFEPFFTTHEDGNAMGLGLSIVKAVLSTCHGHIEARNASGGGAVFHVVFPESLDKSGKGGMWDPVPQNLGFSKK